VCAFDLGTALGALGAPPQRRGAGRGSGAALPDGG
jgi:hypothetical protein